MSKKGKNKQNTIIGSNRSENSLGNIYDSFLELILKNQHLVKTSTAAKRSKRLGQDIMMFNIELFD